MAYMFHRDVDALDIDRYMRALITAQADIDVDPDRCRIKIGTGSAKQEVS